MSLLNASPALPGCSEPDATTRRIIPLSRGGVDWEIQAHVVADLLDDQGLRLEQWRSQDRLRVIKSGPHRTVYRVDAPSGRYFIKHYKIASCWAVVQNLFRPCKADLEWKAAAEVTTRGLRTFEAVAIGRMRRGGVVTESYLISRAIDDACPLEEFLTHELPRRLPTEQTRLRRELVTEVARLAARLHARGAMHHDFHAGNILVQFDAAARPRLWLIDLHTMRFGAPPTMQAVKDNLVVLNQLFVGKATRTDRLRFFLAYAAARQESGEFHWTGPDLPARIRDVEEYCRQAAIRWWRRSDRRWARGNRHLIKLNVPGIGCRGLSALGTELLTAIRDAPDALFEDPVRFWCKTTGKHRVAGVNVPIRGQAVLCYWKRAESHGLWSRFVSLCRRSRVRHAWEVGHAFLRRGLPTPQPLAYVEVVRGLQFRQFLLTAGIPESVTLATFLRSYLPQLTPTQQRGWLSRFARRLADQIRAMHSYRFDHRDLKASNILVSENPASSDLWLLDLDAVRRWPWLPKIRAIQNLARLAVSSMTREGFQPSDRLRFLVRYLGTRDKAVWKPWWRSIAARCSRKIRHNQRTGRPLT